MSDEYLWIYAIPELQLSKDMTITDPPILAAIRAIPLVGGGFRRGGLSRPCVDSRYTRLVLYIGSGIYGLVIPHDDTCPPRVSALTKFGTVMRGNACVGLRRALVRLPGDLAMTQSYPCPGTNEIGLANDNVPALHCRIPKNANGRALLLMDEATGRIVQPQYFGETLVFDFSLYHRSS